MRLHLPGASVASTTLVTALAAALLGATFSGANASPAPTAFTVPPVSGTRVQPFHWELLDSASANEPGPDQQVDLAMDPKGLVHVSWTHTNAPNDQGVVERRLTAADVLEAGFTAPIDHVASLTNPAADFVPVDKTTMEEWYGAQTAATGGIFDSNSQNSVTDPPSWLMSSGPVFTEAAWGRPLSSATAGATNIPILAYEANSHVQVNDTIPGGGSAAMVVPTPTGDTDGSPVVVPLAGGGAELGWCRFGSTAPGTYVQAIDPPTNTLIGSATRVPGTGTSCVLQAPVSRRTPLVGVPGGGFVAAGTTQISNGALGKVLIWRSGTKAATTVDSSTANHYSPQVTVDPSGRLWVGWIAANAAGVHTLYARRSNPARTAWGATVSVAAPTGWDLSSFEGLATKSRWDVVGQFAKPGPLYGLRHTIVLPGLTLHVVSVTKLSTTKRKVTYRVTDAGTAVPGARVTAHGVSGLTGTTGRVTLTFTASNNHAQATKTGYHPGRV